MKPLCIWTEKVCKKIKPDLKTYLFAAKAFDMGTENNGGDFFCKTSTVKICNIPGNYCISITLFFHCHFYFYTHECPIAFTKKNCFVICIICKRVSPEKMRLKVSHFGVWEKWWSSFTNKKNSHKYKLYCILIGKGKNSTQHYLGYIMECIGYA